MVRSYNHGKLQLLHISDVLCMDICQRHFNQIAILNGIRHFTSCAQPVIGGINAKNPSGEGETWKNEQILEQSRKLVSLDTLSLAIPNWWRLPSNSHCNLVILMQQRTWCKVCQCLRVIKVDFNILVISVIKPWLHLSAFVNHKYQNLSLNSPI